LNTYCGRGLQEAIDIGEGVNIYSDSEGEVIDDTPDSRDVNIDSEFPNTISFQNVCNDEVNIYSEQQFTDT